MGKILFFIFVLSEITFAMDRLSIVVSILPQREFIKKIGGERVNVIVLAGTGSSPHSYEPFPSQLAEIGKAKAYLTIGVEFEKSLLPKLKSLYPNLKFFDTTKNVEYRILEKHSHEEEREEKYKHEGEIKDPHIWLGYKQVKTILSNTFEALIELKPADAVYFKQNYTNYLAEIDKTFHNLSVKLSPFKGKKIFVFHPAFGYFLENFGLKQESIEVGGKEPTQRHIVEIIRKAKKEKVKVIFVQKQFSRLAAEKIANAIGGKVVEIDPLSPDWLENVNYMGNIISESLKNE